jgi:phosphoadenosine phosphosulfate reductase
MLDQLEIIELNEQLHNADPKEILNQLVELIPNTAISFSGAEDVLLIEFTQNQTTPPPIFTLDTGRLHPETSSFIEEVKKHYNRSIEALLPNQTQVNKLINNRVCIVFMKMVMKNAAISEKSNLSAKSSNI